MEDLLLTERCTISVREVDANGIIDAPARRIGDTIFSLLDGVCFLFDSSERPLSDPLFCCGIAYSPNGTLVSVLESHWMRT